MAASAQDNPLRIAVWAKGARGAAVLRALVSRGDSIGLVVAQREDDHDVLDVARQAGLPTAAPADPHEPSFIARLRDEAFDVFVLAGYGLILRRELIDLPRRLCCNLHGGRVPQYRGSSPLNWALINGESEIGISVLRVDEGIDTGEVLAARTHAVQDQTTIADLHAFANAAFPEMVLEVLDAERAGTLRGTVQQGDTTYWPRRFPDDGLILWDQVTAREAHDRIRALAPPYPGAFSFLGNRRVVFESSRMPEIDHRGEPGRIYRASAARWLVAASDRCLEVTAARDAETGESALPQAKRYDALTTVRGTILRIEKERQST